MDSGERRHVNDHRARALQRFPRHDRRGEARLPAVLATLAAVLLYLVLPEQLLFVPRFVLPGLELLLLIPLIAVNPRRMTRQNRFSRLVSLTLVALIGLSNLVSLGLLVNAMVTSQAQEGGPLLLAALQVWATDIIVFGLAFWELDRGGPVMRTQAERSELPLADFRFSQDENDDAIEEVADGSSRTSDWVPTLMDYLYVSRV
ncbi:hypothetical protein [Kitasatospora phosalacinea]|uniref:Uncharacterized protein n=1 Tax=Kitasatospora phosalacinea TaxID=2065 RepID=A0A9W6PIB0_9ACTN|nr:hypothetical protein [Kitasatospora phosalacinea]GLW55459.1 hypothetical protein Kpho01_34700 [Kitasatospora phosalacinea]